MDANMAYFHETESRFWRFVFTCKTWDHLHVFLLPISYLCDFCCPVYDACCQYNLSWPVEHPIITRHITICFHSMLHYLLQTQFHYFFHLHNTKIIVGSQWDYMLLHFITYSTDYITCSVTMISSSFPDYLSRGLIVYLTFHESFSG